MLAGGEAVNIKQGMHPTRHADDKKSGTAKPPPCSCLTTARF